MNKNSLKNIFSLSKEEKIKRIKYHEKHNTLFEELNKYFPEFDEEDVFKFSLSNELKRRNKIK